MSENISRETRIFDLLKEHRSLCTGQLSSMLHIPIRDIHVALTSLAKKKLVQRRADDAREYDENQQPWELGGARSRYRKSSVLSTSK